MHMTSKKRILELHFSSDPKRLKMVRDEVQQSIGRLKCTKKLVSDLIIAVNEACMNIMVHAYKGDRSGEIVLEISDNGGEIEVVLTDFADPIDLRSIDPIGSRELDHLRPGGLGTHFMKETMDECAYAHLKDNHGNVLRMTKRFVS